MNSLVSLVIRMVVRQSLIRRAGGAYFGLLGIVQLVKEALPRSRI